MLCEGETISGEKDHCFSLLKTRKHRTKLQVSVVFPGNFKVISIFFAMILQAGRKNVFFIAQISKLNLRFSAVCSGHVMSEEETQGKGKQCYLLVGL